MKQTRRALIVLVAAIALIGIGFLSVKGVQDNELLQLLQKFTVTLHNQSWKRWRNIGEFYKKGNIQFLSNRINLFNNI